MKKVFFLCSIFFLLNGEVDYSTQIQPIWDNNCGPCHLIANPFTGNYSGNLNLNSYESLMESGTIEPGEPLLSDLYDEIETGQMPPYPNSLLQSEIELVYQWIIEGAQPEATGCSDPEAYNCENNDSYIIEVGGILYDNSCNSCDEGITCDGYYGSNTDCYYPQAPDADNIEISYIEGEISIDWSLFNPPQQAILESFHIQRCADGGCSWVDGASPTDSYIDTQIIDYYDWQSGIEIKYVVAVKYANNPYWGYALGYDYIIPQGCTLAGDINNDTIQNVLDVIGLVNSILSGTADELGDCADVNMDSVINILDVVTLVNIILG